MSLTVSATLRDPLASGVGPEHPLMVYLSSVGFDASSKEAEASEPTSSSSDSDDGDEEGSTFEEINLLEGLASGEVESLHYFCYYLLTRHYLRVHFCIIRIK